MLLQSNYKNNNNNNTNVVFNPNATRFMPQQQQQQQQPVTNKKEDNNTNLSFFDTEKLLKFASTSFDENKTSDKPQLLPSYVETAWNSVVEPAAINKDQWMNDISIGINIHNIISQANSPLQDDNASSTSSLMSRSSDSGFRSTFFIGDEETNKQIVHIQQQQLQQQQQRQLVQQQNQFTIIIIIIIKIGQVRKMKMMIVILIVIQNHVLVQVIPVMTHQLSMMIILQLAMLITCIVHIRQQNTHNN